MFNFNYSSIDLLKECFVNLKMQTMDFSSEQNRFYSKKHLLDKHFSGINIIFSDEIPLGFNPEDFKRKLVKIDTILGVYNPVNQEIVIYFYPISICAKELNLNTQHLTVIVILHEIGHYLSRIGFDGWQQNLVDDLKQSYSDNETLQKRFEEFTPWQLEHFNNTDNKVHELLAQLYCNLAFDCGNKDLIDTFKKLAEHQPDEYKTYQAFPYLTLKQVIDFNKYLMYLNRPANPNDIGTFFFELIKLNWKVFKEKLEIVNYLTIFLNEEQMQSLKSFNQIRTAVKYKLI